MKTEKMCLWCKNIFNYKEWAEKTIMCDLFHWEKKKFCDPDCSHYYNYYKCSEDELGPRRKYIMRKKNREEEKNERIRINQRIEK